MIETPGNSVLPLRTVPETVNVAGAGLSGSWALATQTTHTTLINNSATTVITPRQNTFNDAAPAVLDLVVKLQEVPRVLPLALQPRHSFPAGASTFRVESR